MGRPVYEKIGYRTAEEYHLWIPEGRTPAQSPHAEPVRRRRAPHGERGPRTGRDEREGRATAKPLSVLRSLDATTEMGAPPRPWKELKVRPLTPRDRDTWIRLRHELWPKHDLEELGLDADKLLDTWKNGRMWRASMLATVLLAEVDAIGSVGFAEVDLRPFADGCRSSPVGYLEGWYVQPRFRRSGVGRALFRASEEWARAQGCQEMASDTEVGNETSRRAHRALGYEERASLVHFRRTLDARSK